ncbi:structure-specific endonuclease subunit SLX1 [Phanerochaete sordida]|uniref:Structure-specific endonuclease subunit SLX1 n=1 Tax=Phanerochaete sordida TaxID=48140 RepID=A0A9P3LG66_9APHY|nr:structure-specific endonuclease subunit SLX1 [Phanerochaete sordida]
MATAATRSTLVNHCIPPFYACYLLKSVRTPGSTATYIGSTPSPPRRIRQHNGEITQGAFKTERNRPWVMQMIVHGFPSKLAALQFEWAWQHPHISRHLRNENGKAQFARSNLIRHRIQVAHGMIRSHPYNTWALHVKLFTEEAVKIWTALANKQPLPAGFTSSIELEGVDGKSGKVGSGRTGPIDVTDSQFTTAHLYKAHTLTGPHHCSVCKEPIADFPANALEVALCPAPTCKSLAHLACLAQSFTTSSPPSAHAPPLVPRGGACPSCSTYVLWGDVVRGCYRVHEGGAGALPEDAGDENAENEDADTNSDADAEDDAMDVDAPLPRRRAAKGKGRARETAVAGPRGRPKKGVAAQGPRAESEEREFFDIYDVSASDSEGGAAKGKGKGKGKAKAPPVARPKGRPKKTVAAKVPRAESEEREFFDIYNVSASESEGGATKGKGKGKGKAKVPPVARPRERPKKTAAAKAPRVESDEREFFDIYNVSASDSDDAAQPLVPPAPKKRGRPPKAALPAPEASVPPPASRLPAENRGSPAEGGAVPDEPPARKRGRPRKDAAEGQRSNGRQEIEFCDLKSDGGLSDALSALSMSPGLSELEEEAFGALRRRAGDGAKPKRGPGRPRKAEYIEISD